MPVMKYLLPSGVMASISRDFGSVARPACLRRLSAARPARPPDAARPRRAAGARRGAPRAGPVPGAGSAAGGAGGGRGRGPGPRGGPCVGPLTGGGGSGGRHAGALGQSVIPTHYPFGQRVVKGGVRPRDGPRARPGHDPALEEREDRSGSRIAKTDPSIFYPLASILSP